MVHHGSEQKEWVEGERMTIGPNALAQCGCIRLAPFVPQLIPIRRTVNVKVESSTLSHKMSGEPRLTGTACTTDSPGVGVSRELDR